MRTAEYMREALAFHKRQRPLLHALEGAIMHEALATRGGGQALPIGAVERIIAKHKQLILGMLEFAKKFDAGAQADGN